jgi:hypothetical protein
VGFFTRWTAGIIVLMLAATPALSMAKLADRFQDGQAEAIVGLAAPDFSQTASFNIPVKSHCYNATINISSMPPGGGYDGHPGNVSVYLGNKPIWGFNGTGYGALGDQTTFLNGAEEEKLDFRGGGGAKNVSFLIPKNAIVQTANITVGCTGSGSLVYMGNLSGTGGIMHRAGDVNGDGVDDIIMTAAMFQAYYAPVYVFFSSENMSGNPDLTLWNSSGYDNYGISISDAGDVNGDGYGDIIVGSGFISGYANRTGGAYIYFGGPAMDVNPDVCILCGTAGNAFGYSVSGAGDVNKDGYDDVIVGDPQNDSGKADAGAAFIFLGGPNMDDKPDVTIICATASDGFGQSVSDAGDMNNDGYADVIVSSYYLASVFFGGPVMDASFDALLSFPAQITGAKVSCAGDVNGDGFDDVLVGGYQSGTEIGKVAMHMGGRSIDSVPDAILTSGTVADFFGTSMSCAGDINEDGFDDVIVGAYARRYTDHIGSAYIFLGGVSMDSTPDFIFNGTVGWDCFGFSVSGAGDVNSDGHDEVLISVPAQNTICIVGAILGLAGPGLNVDTTTIWKHAGYFNGTCSAVDFSAALRDIIKAAEPYNDMFNNGLVLVALNANSSSAGRFTLSGLDVIYTYSTVSCDFSGALNTYISGHRDEADAMGNLDIPLLVRSRSEGRLRLSDLNVVYNGGPEQTWPIPTTNIEEGSLNEYLLNLRSFFWDEYDEAAALTFRIANITNFKYVSVWLTDGYILSAEALIDDDGNNWTGVVELSVACIDSCGLVTVSNNFTITVRKHNNPPVFTSAPVLEAPAGQLYAYVLSATDADNESIEFGLEEFPDGMTLDNITGRIEWLPSIRGVYAVVATASDGRTTVRQPFNITVPDIPPRFTSSPPTSVFLGAYLLYTVTAVDDEGDPMKCQFWTNARDMVFEPSNWTLSWTPDQVGVFNVSFSVSDGMVRAYQNFTIEVLQPNRAPSFIGAPVTKAMEDTPYSYDAGAVDEDGDVLTFVLLTWPTGMTVNSTSGLINWTPSEAGKIPVILSVRDQNGGEVWQEFTINVSAAVRPKVSISSPGMLSEVEGEMTVRGRVAKGTREVQRVEVRLDGGQWKNATGTSNWTFNINTRGLKNGRHTIYARAFDGKVYSPEAKVDVVVNTREFLTLDSASLLVITFIVVLVIVGLGVLLVVRRK